MCAFHSGSFGLCWCRSFSYLLSSHLPRMSVLGRQESTYFCSLLCSGLYFRFSEPGSGFYYYRCSINICLIEWTNLIPGQSWRVSRGADGSGSFITTGPPRLPISHLLPPRGLPQGDLVEPEGVLLHLVPPTACGQMSLGSGSRPTVLGARRGFAQWRKQTERAPGP